MNYLISYIISGGYLKLENIANGKTKRYVWVP